MTDRLQEIRELHQMVVPDHQSEYALIQMAPLLYDQVTDLLRLLDAETERLGVLRQIPCSCTCHTAPQGPSPSCPCDNGTVTDSRYQAAWELLIDPASPTTPQHCWWVVGWPDCAVRGLLEGVVTVLGKEWADRHLPFTEGFWIITTKGENRFVASGDAKGLGKALLEALNGYK